MKKIIYSIIFLLLIGLCLFGLLSVFMAHPMALFIQLAIIGLIVLVGLFFFQRLLENPTQRQYHAAVKQTKKQKHGRLAAYRRLRSMRAARLKVISNHRPALLKGLTHPSAKDQKHLTVIEGKKHKKKKRVLF
ncbi:MAG: SA1362 family protein [Sporolactobacillus sp.]